MTNHNLTQIKENEDMVSVHFDSILEVIEGDFSKQDNSYEINNYLKGDVDSQKYGSTNKTHEEVIKHALIGDEILLVDLKKKIDVLNKVTGKNTMDYEQKIQSSRRRRCFADQGDELDIEKVYNGELDTCWSKTQRIEFDTSHKFVTLFIENGANWNEDVTDSFWRSAIAVFLTSELEKAGKSVRIVVGSTGNRCFIKNRKLLSCSMTVKEYNQRVSLERVSAMTHLGFFRTLNFAMINMPNYKISGGLGSHKNIDDKSFPIQLQEQVKQGHTRLIHIKPVLNQHEAINALEYAYKQLKS